MCARWSAGGRAVHVLALVAALAALLILVPAASAQLEDAWFEGNLSYDTVSGPGFTPYATVSVVVKDAPGGTVLYEGSATVNALGWFEVVPGVDLVPGMYISVSEGAITKDVTLAALSIDAIDPAENTVSGTAPPNAEFGVDAVVGGEWPGLVVTADENGDWTADFDDIGVDITPYTHVGAAIFNDNGGATAVDLQLMELPAFDVHPGVGEAGIFAKFWPAASTLTVTIDDPLTPPSPDYKTEFVAVETTNVGYGGWFDVQHEIKAGDVVVVTDGTTTKSHAVVDIRVTSVDVVADRVSGTVPMPNSAVHLFFDVIDGAKRNITADDSGHWMADFSVSGGPDEPPVDIVPGTSGGAAQFDDDGDATVVGWQVPRPEGRQHNPATGHNYLYVEAYMSWADAEAYAVTLGGHLVTINDAAEDEWLVATFGTEYFIGLNDIAVEGAWAWASGEPVTFTGWLDGEPNDDFGPAGEDVVMIWNRPPIGWNDIPVDSLAPFVVELAAPDTTPPTTSATGYDGWHNHPVTVTFKAKDNPGGSGVAKTEYKLDANIWTAGTSVTVNAPSGGYNDGTHHVLYRSIDKAGNVEVANACTVNIDTERPVTRAPYSASGSRMSVVGLYYLIWDDGPNGGTVDVTITVEGYSRYWRVKKTITLDDRPVDALLVCTFKCTLAPGSYRFYVYATDAAGNTQAEVGSNTLSVRRQ